MEANRLLQIVQVEALQNPTPQNFQQERDLHQKWLLLRDIEECFFKRKSRINWLKEGDLNTSYFFRICQTRASFNAIRSFFTASGVLLTDPLEMSNYAVAHFKSILGPSNYCTDVYSPPSWFATLIQFRVSSQQQSLMISMPTVEEIHKLFFKLNPNKASGPDGLTSGFFRGAWDIIGSDVTTAISQFFSSAFLPAAANATILSMVPKRQGATAVTDYRPISCLNTVYKVVSRLLVKRLKPILLDLIVPNQTAFVKGRLLLENTVLAGELVNGYHKNSNSKRITIKVDIAKAFDTLSWSFLFSCLEGIVVPPLFIRWLRACVCTPSYMVGYNGTVNGYFKGTRGLRQGDPLSPYLFVIAMNCLSKLLNRASANGSIGFHPRTQSTRLTHLSFADDLLIFIDGSLSSVQHVLQVLREFELRSGLAVSVQKSSFFSSGLSQLEIDVIQASTGMPHGTLPVRYLGVPLCTRKLSLIHCEQLIQQVKAKFTSWTVKTLSFAGRLLLIKTVIAGITNFWCSSFVLPKACVKRINSLCGVFLWKGNIEVPPQARVAWATVTKPKSEGGLGVIDLAQWNKATCLKLIWLLFFKAGSVWVAWYRTEVLQGNISNFWTAKQNRSNSWLANKLLKLRPLIFPWIKMRIGNGLTCRFWYDNWSPYECLDDYYASDGSTRLGISRRAVVADLSRDGSWRMPQPRTEIQLQVISYITSITLQEQEDYYEWELNGKTSTSYSTGEVYRILQGSSPQVTWSSSIWFTTNIPRHAFLAWLFVLDRCPTRDRMSSWGLQVNTNCLLCATGMESRDHLLFDCDFSYSIWSAIAPRTRVLARRNWAETLSAMETLQGNKLIRRLTLLSWQSTIYAVWKERNARLHRNIFRSPDSIVKEIDRQIINKISAIRSTNPIASSFLMQFWFSSSP